MGPIALDIKHHTVNPSEQSLSVPPLTHSFVDAFTVRKEEEKNCMPSQSPPSSSASNLPCFSIPQSTDAHWDVRAVFSPPPPTLPSPPCFFVSFFSLPFSLSLTCEWQPIRGRVASASASVTSTARSDARLEKERGGDRGRERGRERRGGGGKKGREGEKERHRQSKKR